MAYSEAEYRELLNAGIPHRAAMRIATTTYALLGEDTDMDTALSTVNGRLDDLEDFQGDQETINTDIEGRVAALEA
jgi:hypothetical protein